MRVAVWAVLCTICFASGHIVLGALGVLLLGAACGGSSRAGLLRARTADTPPADQPRAPARTG
jgi:hypothetical protein